VVAYIDQC